ncbi:MAG TPA: site-2 protease family protein [Candidatus Hydrogenedentes bacterium]|nr:site-2 protease family protein [Candidatus Hydrogenedentota bacterium]
MVDILIFLAVLSGLIFVHELGHFLAAKACNIYVDRFSIFMPPRLFGKRLGETDYCVGLLPIGGYVTMPGQEDTPLTEEERQKQFGHVPPDRWFDKKPVWQRFIVSFSGPLMNFVFAIIIYSIMVAIGSNVPESEVMCRIGMVEPESPAASAPLYIEQPGKALKEYTGQPDATGWQTGDFPIAIDGKETRTFSDLAYAAALGGTNSPHYILLERIHPDQSRTRYVSPIIPKIINGGEIPRFGITPFDTAVVGEVMDNTPAKAAGLQKNDVIVRADGALVDMASFRKKTEETPEGTTINIEVQRDKQVIKLAIVPQTIGRIKGLAYGPENEKKDDLQAQPVIKYIENDFAKTTGIKRKDIIKTVNGQPATIELMEKLEREHQASELNVDIDRPAVLFGLIQKESTLTAKVPVESVRAIGVRFAPKLVFHRSPPSQWLSEGFRQSYSALRTTWNTIVALVKRDVSPKELGGPIMIARIVTQAAENGWFWLMKFTAFISVNLSLVNLLPVPALDGGLILLLGYETIRRKPPSKKFMVRFQLVGISFIVFLMIFVTRNDIYRWIQDLTP